MRWLSCLAGPQKVLMRCVDDSHSDTGLYVTSVVSQCQAWAWEAVVRGCHYMPVLIGGCGQSKALLEVFTFCRKLSRLVIVALKWDTVSNPPATCLLVGTFLPVRNCDLFQHHSHHSRQAYDSFLHNLYSYTRDRHSMAGPHCGLSAPCLTPADYRGTVLLNQLQANTRLHHCIHIHFPGAQARMLQPIDLMGL